MLRNMSATSLSHGRAGVVGTLTLNAKSAASSCPVQAMKKVEAKNALENYAYQLRNTTRDEKVRIHHHRGPVLGDKHNCFAGSGGFSDAAFLSITMHFCRSPLYLWPGPCYTFAPYAASGQL